MESSLETALITSIWLCSQNMLKIFFMHITFISHNCILILSDQLILSNINLELYPVANRLGLHNVQSQLPPPTAKSNTHSCGYAVTGSRLWWLSGSRMKQAEPEPKQLCSLRSSGVVCSNTSEKYNSYHFGICLIPSIFSRHG